MSREYTLSHLSILLTTLLLSLNCYAVETNSKDGHLSSAANKNMLGNIIAKPGSVINARFKEMDIATLLRLIARESGQSIIIDGEIKEKISIDFEQTPVEEALKSVLEVGRLEMQKNGNVIVIQPREKHFISRSFKVYNINAGELLEKLTSLFSDQVRLQADNNTNTVLVSGPANHVRDVEKIVKQLDEPKKQVMIDAAIIEVSISDSNTMGVNLASFLQVASNSLSLSTAGFAADPAIAPNPVGFFGQGNLFLNKTNRSVDGMIEALQTVTDLNVLSHPKVIGVNGEEAELIVGQKLGFRVTTTINNVSTESIEFLEVGTQLKFTPHITENDEVIMEIHPEISDGSISEDGLPNETTTEITTQARVADGETIVLGGLIRKRTEKIEEKVPLLGDLPFLGVMFRRTVDTMVRAEILVLMTPHIVKDADVLATQRDINRIQKKYLKNKTRNMEVEIKSAMAVEWPWPWDGELSQTQKVKEIEHVK